MANRIKELDGTSIGASNGSSVESIKPSKAVTSASAEAGGSSRPAADSVHITNSARTLAALSQAVRDTPELDSGRVATLQQSIDSGQYSIDPDRIAARMLQLEQDLGGTQQQ